MFLVLSAFGFCLEIQFRKAGRMGLQSLTDRVAKNGAVIDAAIAKGIGAAPVIVTGTTDAQLDVLEQALTEQDAKLQTAIDNAGTGGGGPVPPGVPGAAKLDSLSVASIPAGVATSVTLKGSGFTGGSVVGTGGLSFANAVVVDDTTVTVDVTGAAPGNQTIGVGSSNELPLVVT